MYLLEDFSPVHEGIVKYQQNQAFIAPNITDISIHAHLIFEGWMEMLSLTYPYWY